MARFVPEARQSINENGQLVKWYEMQQVSQAKAAEVAGISRAEFLAAQSRFGVTPFQYDTDEIVEEVGRPQMRPQLFDSDERNSGYYPAG